MPARLGSLLLSLVALAAACHARSAAPAARPSATEVRAVALLRARHVAGERIPRGEIDLDGAVRALGDPWTRIYGAQQAAQLMADLAGSRKVGVGLPELLSIDLDAAGRRLEIVAPQPDSAAARAGLQAHDVVVEIDRRAVDASRYAEAMAALRVGAGERVSLTIERAGAARQVVLVAAPLTTPPPVAASRRDGALVVRFGPFGPSTASAFAGVLARERAEALEIDLRGHTGGRVDAALAIAGMLAPGAGELTVAEVVGRRGQRTPIATRAAAKFSGPVTVRVDGGTASAAELLAHALRLAGRARVVGARTFGKCLVHQAEPLSGKRLLLLTTGRLAEPGAAPWCGRGIAPDAAG